MRLEGNFSEGESSYWLISKGISSTSIYFQRQFACSHVRDCEKVTCKLIRVPLLSGRKITVLPPLKRDDTWIFLPMNRTKLSIPQRRKRKQAG